MNKCYQELILLPTFEERFEYLKLSGMVGKPTFGHGRYLNQVLYQSRRWKYEIRPQILIRDDGCDLGIRGREVFACPTIHHITPVTIEDIELGRWIVFDPDNLITTSSDTHRAIHYGDISLLPRLPPERRKGDTCPWSKAF